MATTKKKAVSRKGAKAQRRKLAKKNGLFDAEAKATAKRVAKTPRVKEAETGQVGTVLGKKGGWLKVKWDNRTRTTLIHPSAVVAVNPKLVNKMAVGAIVRRVKKNTTIIRAKRVKVTVLNPKRRPAKARTTKRKNPAPRGAAKRKFEEFQGRGASKVTSENVSSLAGKRKLYAIGPLKELKIKGVGVRQGARGSKLLADTKGKLWISEKIGTARPGSTGLVKIGEVEHVVYHARKPHVEADKWQDFLHQLGEETGKLPTLFIDPQGFGVLKGGAYTIESRGIVN